MQCPNGREEKRKTGQAILSEVSKGFRVWVILGDGRKAVVDSKKLMIYQATTAPLSHAGEYAPLFEKRVREPEEILLLGIKKRLFQKNKNPREYSRGF